MIAARVADATIWMSEGDLGVRKQAELPGVDCQRQAAVGAWVEPGLKTREAILEFLKRPGTAAGKARFLPDFV